MKTAEKTTNSRSIAVQMVAGRPVAGSIVEDANKVAASKKRSTEVARKAGIVTKSGRLTKRYK